MSPLVWRSVPSVGDRTAVPYAAKMSVPSWRWKLGTHRGSHQSSPKVAGPATGNRPKPAIAAWSAVRPKSCNGSSASVRLVVLLALDRTTELINAWYSGGTTWEPLSTESPPLVAWPWEAVESVP